jgi:hypothetical protein
MTREERTQKVMDCNSHRELRSVIKELAPFVSNSRMQPVEHHADLLMEKIYLVINRGHPLALITRENGLRAKVAELMVIQNYGEPWYWDNNNENPD